MPIHLPVIFAVPPAGGRFYLDPGTGSQILQILIAGGLSVLVAFGLLRKQLAAFFRRLTGRRAAAPDADNPADDD
jgi:hypothetical protein